MKRPDKSLKNTIKNITLVVLVLLLGVLTVLAWDVGLLGGGVQLGAQPLEWLQSRLPMGDGGYVQRAGETPAASPVRIAMTTEDGQMIGAAYQEAQTSALLEPVRPLWADAIVQAGAFVQADEQSLKTALEGDTMLLEYAGRIPISLLAGWFGGETKEGMEPCAGTLVLTADGALFVRDPKDGVIYLAQTTVDAAQWASVRTSVAASPCSYAAQQPGAHFEKLYPETLLMQDSAAYEIHTARAPDFWATDTEESLQRLLEAFQYDVNLQSFSEEEGDTQVFVDSYSSLRVSTDGTVRFKATSVSNGIRAYQAGEAEGVNAVAAQVDRAQKLLVSALRAVGSKTQPTLLSMSADAQTGNTTLVFSQTLGGVPIIDSELARLEFSGSMLTSAELHLSVFEPTGESLYVLPAAQVAAASAAGRKSYVVAYQSAQDGRLLPGAYLR